MPGKFVLKTSSGGYHVNLLATNGKVIASSERYQSRAAAMRGIGSVRKNAGGAALVEDDGGAADKKTTAKRSAEKVIGPS